MNLVNCIVKSRSLLHSNHDQNVNVRFTIRNKRRIPAKCAIVIRSSRESSLLKLFQGNRPNRFMITKLASAMDYQQNCLCLRENKVVQECGIQK